MKMTSRKMKDELTKRLEHPDWLVQYNRDKDELRVEHRSTGRGITVSIPGIVAKWEVSKEKAIEEVVYYVKNALFAMQQEETAGTARVVPVIRSTSFPAETEAGNPLVVTEHTAETRIYYALDSEKTYRLIDQRLLSQLGLNEQQVREMAQFHVRSLSSSFKADEVAGNIFYFLNSNDGYDASRILNEPLLQEMKQKMTGDMVVAVPHQDVLIIADVRNETGYDIMAQMAMKFFAEGRVPITALSFLYEDNELEPIFILGKNRPIGKRRKPGQPE